jgi:hypothetical protein
MIFRKSNWKFVNKNIIWEQLKWLKDGCDEIVRTDWETRTNDQNRYLRGAVYPAIHQWLNWAYTCDEIHWLMSFQFLQKVSKGWSTYIQSTSRLTTAEFSKYVENIKDFVAQYGIYIPTAEEYKQWMEGLNEIYS